MVNHRRLRVDSRKWYVSKLAPKRYGDRIDLYDSNGEKQKIDDTQRAARIAAILSAAVARKKNRNRNRMAQINDILEILKYLTQSEADEVAKLIDEDLSQVIWRPIPGPQTMAYNSVADIIGYGGAAGGGKTDLMCGMALTKHRKAMILRRVGTELTGIVDRIEELLGTKDGYSDKRKIWRPPGRSVQIELGALPDLGDEKKFQGRPHDFLAFDEATNFFASQVRFPSHHGCARQCLASHAGCCSDSILPYPPDGRWVIPFFAPWLDKTKIP